jgi:hypothetical protein
VILRKRCGRRPTIVQASPQCKKVFLSPKPKLLEIEVIESLKMKHGYFQAESKKSNLNKMWKIFEEMILEITEEIFVIRHQNPSNTELHQRLAAKEYEIIYN